MKPGARHLARSKAAPTKASRRHVAALNELLAVFSDPETVRALQPDLAAIGRLEGLRGDRVQLSGRAVTVLDGELRAD